MRKTILLMLFALLLNSRDLLAAESLRDSVLADLRLSTLETCNLDSLELKYISALQEDSTFDLIQLEAGLLLFRQQKFEQSSYWLSRYLSLADSSQHRDAVGHLVLRMRSALSLGPNSAEILQLKYKALTERGIIHLRCGNVGQSLEDASLAMTLDSSRYEAYALAAMCMRHLGKYEEMGLFAEAAKSVADKEHLPVLDSLIQQSNQSSKSNLAPADAAMVAGNYDDAARLYSEIFENESSDEEAKIRAATAHFLAGNRLASKSLAVFLQTSSNASVAERAKIILQRLE